MNPLWVEEGMRQFRLGVAWQRLACSVRCTPRKDVQCQAEDVLTDFTRREWIPGLGDALKQVADRDFTDQHYELLQEHLRQTIEARATADEAEQEERDQRKFSQVISDCFKLSVDVVWLSDQPGEDLEKKQRRLARRVQELPDATLVMDSFDAAATWLSQAVALVKWFQLNEKIRQERAFCQELDTARAELDRLRSGVKRSWKAARRRWSLLNHMGWHERQLRHVCQRTGACLEQLEGLSRRAPLWTWPKEEQDRNVLVGAIQRELDRCPRGWPPWLLAEWQRRLPERTSGRFADLLHELHEDKRAFENSFWQRMPLDLPKKDRACCGLVCAIGSRLRALEAKGKLCGSDQRTVWSAFGDVARELLRPAGGDVQIQQQPNDKSFGDSGQRGARGESVRVAKTGFRLTWGGKKAVRVDASYVFPRPSSTVIAPLRRLSAALGRLVTQPSQPDGGLPELCRRFWKEVKDHDSVAHWLEKGPGSRNERELLTWRIVQRVCALAEEESEEIRALAAAVLTEFQEEGVQLTGPKRTSEGWVDPQGPAMVTAGELAAGDFPEQHWAVGVAMPDGPEFLPSAWYSVPASWSEDRRLVRFLINNQLFIAELFALESDWPDWANVNQLVRHALYSADRRSREKTDGEVGKGLFEVFHRYSQDRSNCHREQFKIFARELLKCLKQMGEQPRIPRDPQSLRRRPLEKKPTDGTVLRWAIDDTQPHRMPLREIPSTKPGERPCLLLSVGPQCPEEIRCWVKIPSPDFLGERAESDHPLARWYCELPEVPWDFAEGRARLQQIRKEFRSWTTTTVGQEWVDDFLHRVWKPPSEQEAQLRAWYRVLYRQRWLECYPVLEILKGPEGREAVPVWPKGQSTDVPGIHWTTDKAVTKRRWVRGEVRFAVHREGAKGEFSLGHPEEEESLAVTERLVLLLREADRFPAGNLQDRLGRLVVSARDTVFQVDPPPDFPAATKDVLESLAQAPDRIPLHEEGEPDRSLRRLDDLFQAVRDLALQFHLSIEPDQWSFVSPPAPEALGLTEEQVARAEFCSYVPKNSLRVLSFGLAKQGGTIPQARLERSAGPAPEHFYELCSKLEKLAEASGGNTQSLFQTLEGWPEAALQNMLRFRGRDLFLEFWESFGAEINPSGPGRDHPLTRLVSESYDSLRSLLKGLGLTTFSGDNLRNYGSRWSEYLEFPGAPPDLAGAQTRSLRTIRPGLRDDKVIHTKALVALG